MTKTISTRLALACALCLSVIAPVFAQSTTPKSGQYEAMLVAVTPEGQVEGYYKEERGIEVVQSCTFYLKGKGDADGNINTWTRNVYPGYLVPSDRGVILAIKDDKTHPGCMDVLPPELTDGIELSLLESKSWIGLVTASTDKAYLLKNPGDKAEKRPYIVKKDVVAVLAYKDGWANVEYINDNGRSFTGWIQDSQYTHLVVPKKNLDD